MTGPILIGGNGHSGTRIFAKILSRHGVFMGIPRITRSSYSFDLHVFDLLDRWVGPYVYGQLDDAGNKKMHAQLRRRLKLFFPFRSGKWGWKNPRSMLMLPVYHELFPDLRFIHVIRDGRDISVGNKLAIENPYVDAFLENHERESSPEENMMRFWGRSNANAADYCASHLPADAYLRVCWENLCEDPMPEVRRILCFAGCDVDGLEATAAIVRRPSSIGRWKNAEPDVRKAMLDAGSEYLTRFGYPLFECSK